MSDIFNKEKRSKIMGLVKGKNTKPEIALRRELHLRGFRFRIHDRRLPGNPDIKLTKYKTVIFINGCFWHAHSNCKYYTIPKTNHEFWVDKIRTNINRDFKNYAALEKSGWNVLVIWTCSLKKKYLNETIQNVLQKIINFNG